MISKIKYIKIVYSLVLFIMQHNHILHQGRLELLVFAWNFYGATDLGRFFDVLEAAHGF